MINCTLGVGPHRRSDFSVINPCPGKRVQWLIELIFQAII